MSTFSNKDNFSGAVLAGGDNKRFPILKGFLKVNRVTIIENNIHLLDVICDEVFVSTNMPELYFKFKVNMVGDIFLSKGPMSGIYTSLLNSKNDNLLVVACDMPFLNLGVLSYIIKKHKEYHDATIPFFNKKLQPLCGIYRKTVLPFLEDHLNSNKNSLYLFLRDIKTNFISEDEIKDVDPYGNSFININTLKDFEIFRGYKSGIVM